jgi:hypothetical protein
MRRLHPILIVIVVGMMASASGHAVTILSATLTNAQENPPAVPTTTSTPPAPRPASFGTALFTLNDSRTAMSFTATIFNIDVTGTQTPNEPNDDLTVAHIHASPTVTPTTNAGVVWGFVGMPFNDNNPPSPQPTMIPFATGVGGTFTGTWDQPEGNGTTLSDQLNNILTGHSYINFHTKQFAGGEIRGAIVEPSSTPAVFQTAGLTASSIQSTVDAFRAELGEPNNANNPGPLASGRREINWDGAVPGTNATTDPVTPFDVFLNTRGARFTTPGTGLSQAPPSGGPPGTPPPGGLAGLFNNPTYGTVFSTFSPLRLFTPVGSNITEALFFIPGTNGATPATVRGFGAVFTDVDQPDGSGPGTKRGNRGASTLIEYFGVDNKVLFSSFVPASPGDRSLSFFGIVFDDARIMRVRITTGDVAPGPDDDGKNDIVVMDDFIYGEPQPAEDLLSTDENARTEAPAPGTRTLKVNNGRGSGRHAAGTMVKVTADAPPAGKKFAGWSGDIQILANPSEPTTTATMPSIEVTLAATYADALSTEPPK